MTYKNTRQTARLSLENRGNVTYKNTRQTARLSLAKRWNVTYKNTRRTVRLSATLPLTCAMNLAPGHKALTTKLPDKRLNHDVPSPGCFSFCIFFSFRQVALKPITGETVLVREINNNKECHNHAHCVIGRR